MILIGADTVPISGCNIKAQGETGEGDGLADARPNGDIVSEEQIDDFAAREECAGEWRTGSRISCCKKCNNHSTWSIKRESNCCTFCDCWQTDNETRRRIKSQVFLGRQKRNVYLCNIKHMKRTW